MPSRLVKKSCALVFLWLSAALALGCANEPPDLRSDGGAIDGGDSSTGDLDATTLQTTFGGDRPVELQVPEAYHASKSWPLMLFLHGYSSSASRMLRYSKMDELVEEVGILLLAPNGLQDTAGLRFWNATDFCCDFSNRNVDDVAYLTGLIDEVTAVYNVDHNRIFVWGHSNGGFMAHRLACERTEQFASVISFAGSTFLDANRCAPTEAISVLQIHGVNDEVIAYSGEAERYPGAQTTVARWSDYNGCESSTRADGPIDLTSDVEGQETSRVSFENCPAGIDVSLWTAAGATHFPTVTDSFRDLMWSWFEAHPKP